MMKRPRRRIESRRSGTLFHDVVLPGLMVLIAVALIILVATVVVAVAGQISA